jgi:hypothetical protein
MAVKPFNTEAELQAHYRRHGFPHAPVTPAPPAKPALPSLQARYPEEAAMRQLEQVADAANWRCEFAWQPTGRFAGLLCHCLRGTEIIVIQVRREGKPLSAWQREWLSAWRATQVAEVWECAVDDLEDVLNRLCQKEQHRGP